MLPNTQGYYQPYYQPPTWQSPLPAPQKPVGIAGRTISNVSDVTPNEVPMDGSVSLFPMKDYSAIFAKAWNGDGTIRTVRYVPEMEQESEDSTKQIIERLDKIEKALYRQKFDKGGKDKEASHE